MSAPLDTLLSALTAATIDLADAQEAEARNEIEKAEHEAALVASLIGNDNPMTGKPHSATSAASAAAGHESVVAYRLTRIAAERRTTLAKGAYEIARIRAWAATRAMETAA